MQFSYDGDVLVVQGVLDVRCTAELRERLYELIDRAEGTVVVDITAVESVDMTSLKLLAVANRVAGRRGGRVVLRGASIGVRRLLHLTHLRSVLPLEPRERPEAPAAHDAEVVPPTAV